MLTELGIFISSPLLSVGGCIAISCDSMRRSRCTNIELSDCMKCNRDVISPGDLDTCDEEQKDMDS